MIDRATDTWLAPNETVVRSTSYPFDIQHPVVPCVPAAPDQTFTLIGGGPCLPMGDATYFMYSAGRIKIGFSGHVWSRRDGLSTSSPFPPVIILVQRGPVSVERDFHKKFAKQRLHGEWFALSGALRSFLRTELCPIGEETLRTAESEFREYCALISRHKPKVHP